MRQISSEETEDAVNSILPKKRRESSGSALDDSGFADEPAEVFHPAFRGQGGNNGMEVDQITSLVSIFSFGQQLFAGGDRGDRGEPAKAKPPQQSKKPKKDSKDQDEDP